MIIGVDVDGVLADFNSAFINRCVAVTGKDLYPSRPFDIQTWHYPQHYGYTDQETSNVWEHIKADCKFWQTLPGYENSREAVQYLDSLRRAGHDVYFTTNRVGTGCKLQTERWLRRFGFDDATVLVTGVKGAIARALSFDVYIDDRWENAVDVAGEYKQVNLTGPHIWQISRTKSFLLVRPWNRRSMDRDGVCPQMFNITEVSTVLSIRDFIDSIAGNAS